MMLAAENVKVRPAIYTSGGSLVEGTNVTYTLAGSPASARIPWPVRDPRDAARHVDQMRRRTGR